MWPLYPTTGATILRAELTRAAGGYGDADSGEDWSLGVSLAYRGQLGWSERPGRLHQATLSVQNTTPNELSRHARAIRDRIRSDGGIPDWVRLALPAIWLGQWAAIGAHAGLEALRRHPALEALRRHPGLEALRQRLRDRLTR
jgi:hypothetical protein